MILVQQMQPDNFGGENTELKGNKKMSAWRYVGGPKWGPFRY